MANYLAATQDTASIAGKVFNVGTGKSTSVNELAYLVATVFGVVEFLMTYRPARAAEIRYSQAMVKAVREGVGCAHSFPFEKALLTTCA